MKHTNYNYSSGVPLAVGDRFFTQDAVSDFRYHEKMNSDIMSVLSGGVNCILSGLVVTQGAGTTFNITLGKALIKTLVTIPDNSAGWTIPAASTTQVISYITEILTNQTNLPIVGWTAGGATNYLKLAYVETNGQTRTRAKGTGIYAFETESSYTLTCNTTAPTSYEIELTRFTEGGGTFTFDNAYRNNQINIDTSLTIASNLLINSTTQSTSKDTGRIITQGGIGAEKDISAGGILRSVGGLEIEYVTSGGVSSKKAVFTKIIEIGDWNMTGITVNVPHGLGVNYKKIISISVIIRDDSDSTYYNLDSAIGDTGKQEGAVDTIGATNIALVRTSSGNGGAFDSVSFDATAYNRGWVIINYYA